MSPDDQNLLRDLLSTQRVATLSVLVAGDPYSGLFLFAMQPTFRAVLIHASILARHTAGLNEGAPFSLLVHAPDSPESDPLQIARISLQGVVHELPKNNSAYTCAREIFIAKHPTSKQTFQLSDFQLYEFKIKKGRFVAGFGRIYNVKPENLENLAK